MCRVTGDERHSNIGCQKPTPSDQHEKALSDEESVWGSLGIWPAQLNNAEDIFLLRSHAALDGGTDIAALALQWG